MIVFLTGLLGSSQAGLTTVGYTVKNNLGQVVAARTTQGVVEIGGGAYAVNLNFEDNKDFVVVWDNGATPPRLAFSIVDTRTVDLTSVTNNLNTVAEAVSDVAESIDNISDSLSGLQIDVDGLKEKNQRRVANDPINPSIIQVDIKKDNAPDWSPANIQEQYQVNIATDSNGDVIRYGG